MILIECYRNNRLAVTWRYPETTIFHAVLDCIVDSMAIQLEDTSTSNEINVIVNDGSNWTIENRRLILQHDNLRYEVVNEK